MKKIERGAMGRLADGSHGRQDAEGMGSLARLGLTMDLASPKRLRAGAVHTDTDEGFAAVFRRAARRLPTRRSDQDEGFAAVFRHAARRLPTRRSDQDEGCAAVFPCPGQH